MDDMEQKLNSILSNPDMMAQIMSMAQNLGQGAAEANRQEKSDEPVSQPAFMAGIDPGMLQKVAGIAQKSGIDRNQQALLKALSPYLTRDRIGKLEKAMRAAKIAGLASGILGNPGSLLFSGR